MNHLRYVLPLVIISLVFETPSNTPGQPVALGYGARCPEATVMAKTGIILSSVISGVLGYVWLRFVSGKPEKREG
ncbi:MAG TPA: hypothetical protein VMW89_17210 [Desulfatiglandales bacterium]|nr:hypothetical protein [Desulfatiglandales bacterium]